LKHENGNEVCKIFGEHHQCRSDKQGAILSMTFLRGNGTIVGYAEVEKLASVSGIHLRSGCFCNAGECHQTLELTNEDVKQHISEGHVCWDDNDVLHGKPTGAIRVSLGYMSSFEDCYRYLDFVKKYFVEKLSPCIAQPSMIENDQDIVVKQIILYPIKSCGGYSVHEWKLGKRGLEFDREWALVDKANRTLTAKNNPKLVTILPEIHPQENKLVINAPDMPTLTILLDNIPTTTISLRVCGDTCEAYSYPSDVNEWFCKYLGFPCELVRKSNASDRTCKIPPKPNSSTEQTTINDQVSFSNESQILVLNEQSVIDVRNRATDLEESLTTTISRFRANIIVSGPSYAEDFWSLVTIQDFPLRGLGRCTRCKMICTHPISGEIHPKGEPLASMATYRREKGGRVLFGAHFSCFQQDHFATIHVEDQVVIKK